MKAIKHPIIAVCIILAFIQTVSAQQFWSWTEPLALTDSISDNQNACLFYNGTFHMVWEKPVDEISTSIWYQDVNTKNAAVEILITPGVHYKHPKIMNTHNGYFFVFYESNENGNIDLYYIEYLGNAGFSEPIPFAISSENEKDVAFGQSDLWGDGINSLVWIQDSNVYHSYLNNDLSFTNPFLIDSGGCSNPVISDYENKVVYEKETAMGRYLSSRRRVSNSWEDPILVFDSLVCQNLNYDKVGGELLTWSVKHNDEWKVAIGYWDNQVLEVEIMERSSPTPLNPAITSYFTPVKSDPDWWGELYLAYPYFENGFDEIFLNTDPWWYPEQYNFTNWQTDSRNPDFFYGPDDASWCDGDYLVWESYKNGHWQIFYAETPQCWGNVSENEVGESFIKTQPNPFTNETSIAFTLENRSEVTVDIFNSRGMHISTLASQSFDPGTHQLRWNAVGLAAGMYIIKMRVGDMTYTSKIIKNQ